MVYDAGAETRLLLRPADQRDWSHGGKSNEEGKEEQLVDEEKDVDFRRDSP